MKILVDTGTVKLHRFTVQQAIQQCSGVRTIRRNTMSYTASKKHTSYLFCERKHKVSKMELYRERVHSNSVNVPCSDIVELLAHAI